MKILASILMSDFIKNQLSQIGIRMNGGLPRFQIQSLKKLRIPDFEKLTEIEKNDLTTSYDRRDLGIINEVINNYCKNQHIQVHWY